MDYTEIYVTIIRPLSERGQAYRPQETMNSQDDAVLSPQKAK